MNCATEILRESSNCAPGLSSNDNSRVLMLMSRQILNLDKVSPIRDRSAIGEGAVPIPMINIVPLRNRNSKETPNMERR